MREPGGFLSPVLFMIRSKDIGFHDISADVCAQDIVYLNGMYLNMKLDLYLIRSHNVLTVNETGEIK
jgi:hypothetical protein